MLIEAEHLRKIYKIHEHQATTLKEMVLKNLFAPKKVRDHVALEDLSFQLDRGQSLGVIGPNGSGKSTLLKLIAGITKPTSGRIEVQGSVASLLELGAGFQSEFTGMENIFLQGRILGLTRTDILRHLDDIIDFSGLGNFIHTPTKRYSTGMIVRLGFAIAAFFDADILLVDEVLAVGDGAFQSRCMDRIVELRKEGKTFVFVSHDLGHVERVAEEVLWLDHGKTRMHGPAETVLHGYEREAQGLALAEGPRIDFDLMGAALSPTVRQGTGKILIHNVEILRNNASPARRIHAGEPVRIVFNIEVFQSVSEVEFWFGFSDPEGNKIALNRSGQNDFAPDFPSATWRDLPLGRHQFAAQIDSSLLTPGHYLLSCSINPAGKPWEFLDMHLRMYRFQVVEGPEPGGSSAERENPAAASGEEPQPSFPVPTPRALLTPPAVWEED